MNGAEDSSTHHEAVRIPVNAIPSSRRTESKFDFLSESVRIPYRPENFLPERKTALLARRRQARKGKGKGQGVEEQKGISGGLWRHRGEGGGRHAVVLLSCIQYSTLQCSLAGLADLLLGLLGLLLLSKRPLASSLGSCPLVR